MLQKANAIKPLVKLQSEDGGSMRTNDGPQYRSRLAAKDFNNHNHLYLHIAAPRFELFWLTASIASSRISQSEKQWRNTLDDFRRAYSHAESTKHTFVQTCAEELEEGDED